MHSSQGFKKRSQKRFLGTPEKTRRGNAAFSFTFMFSLRPPKSATGYFRVGAATRGITVLGPGAALQTASSR